jgi:hypothetical protein
MALTLANLFQNQAKISSAAYNSATKTLTIVFTDDLTAIQQFGAILGSGYNGLAGNTDTSVNMGVSTATQNTTTRNSVSKNQINLSFQVYAPGTTPSYDPMQL